MCHFWIFCEGSEANIIFGFFKTNFSIFTMAFCLKGKAMVMRPPVSPGDVSNLRGCVRTDKNKHVCN